MSNSTDIISIIKAISGQAGIVTIPKIYIRLTGELEAAVFLSQCVYWSDKTNSSVGFYKTVKDWEDEIGLSRHQIDRLRDKLSRYVTTRLKKANGAPTLHYHVNMDVLIDDMVKMLGEPPAPPSPKQENVEPELTKTANSPELELTKSAPDLSESGKSIDLSESGKSLTSINQTISTSINSDEILFSTAENQDLTPTAIVQTPERPSSQEQHKAGVITALVRGARRNGGIKDDMSRLFHINANLTTKEGKTFVEFIMERPAEETIEKFAQWWYSEDFRGQRGSPPNLKWVMELWPQAFIEKELWDKSWEVVKNQEHIKMLKTGNYTVRMYPGGGYSLVPVQKVTHVMVNPFTHKPYG